MCNFLFTHQDFIRGYINTSDCPPPEVTMTSNKIQNKKRKTTHTFLYYFVWSVALWPLRKQELGCRTAARFSWWSFASWQSDYSILEQTAKSGRKGGKEKSVRSSSFESEATHNIGKLMFYHIPQTGFEFPNFRLSSIWCRFHIFLVNHHGQFGRVLFQSEDSLQVWFRAPSTRP